MMLFLLLSAAWAHHDTAVTRLSAEAAADARVEGEVSAPRLDLGLGFDASTFRRRQRGWERLNGAGGPTVLTQAAWIGTTLPSGTSFVATVPTAQILTSKSVYGGLGDISLQAAQRVGPLRVSAGVSLPTGATGGAGAVQTVHVEGSEGGLTVLNTDTRTQPGLGVWALLGNLRVQGDVGPTELLAELGARLPLGASPDDIRWGRDVNLGLGLRHQLGDGPLRVGAALDGWGHSSDATPMADGSLSTGGRLGLAASALADVAVGERAKCSVRAQLPVVQWVEDTQYVQTLRGALSCGVALGGRRQQTD